MSVLFHHKIQYTEVSKLQPFSCYVFIINVSCLKMDASEALCSMFYDCKSVKCAYKSEYDFSLTVSAACDINWERSTKGRCRNFYSLSLSFNQVIVQDILTGLSYPGLDLKLSRDFIFNFSIIIWMDEWFTAGQSSIYDYMRA